MKPYYRYQMDFSGKYIRWSLLSMAISFFFYMVYTFGVTNLADAGFLKAVFVMLLPTILTVGYVVLLKIKEMNAPGIYGLIGAGICLCALIGTFFSGSAIRIILGIIWYPVCGALLLACVGGYLPSIVPAAVGLGVAAGVRAVILLLSGLSLEAFVSGVALIFSLIALLFLPLGLKQGRFKNESNS